jgi:histidyl-tRNA synthetase
MSTGALPGFRDFYPDTFAQRAYLFGVWRDVARRFGFVEYDGPPLEPLELYTRKSGAEIVGQLYNFEDKGGRAVALRPEMTPTFARMVAGRANSLRKPVRWFSIPQLFRYERQQRGRLREHFQLNVDIVGEPDVTADAELLAVAIEIMRSCGLTSDDVRARVSDRRLLTAMLLAMEVTADQVPAAYTAIDKIDRGSEADFHRLLAQAGVSADVSRRVYDTVMDASPVSIRQAFAGSPAVCEHLDRLDRYFDSLTALGVAEFVRLDLRIVRGLAYYTGIVFELFDVKGELRAICGGGRYDTLLQALGDVDLPALGFGMGDVVLTELLRDRGLLPAAATGLGYWVAPVEPAFQLDAARVAGLVRRAGGSAEYPLRDQALAKQVKAAATAGASRVIFVGAALRERGEVDVKSLAEGTQRTTTLDALLTQLTSHHTGDSDRP